MSKLTLTDITGGYQTTTAVNANNSAIESAMENTLSRDGTTPNTMSANIDMNSNDINNANVVTTQALTVAGSSVVAGDTLTVPSATNVPFSATGSISSTDVQAAIAEVDTDVQLRALDTDLQSVANQLLTLGTSQTATGTFLDFSIPSGVKVVHIVFANVSDNLNGDMQIVLGDSGGLEATGYTGASQGLDSSGNTINTTSDTTGYIISGQVAGDDLSGIITLCRVNSSHLWVASGTLMTDSGGTLSSIVGGAKTLSGELTTVRVTGLGGAATFDQGEITVIYG